MSGQLLVASPDLATPLSSASIVPLSVAARDPFAHPIGETALASHPAQRRSIEGRVAATHEAPACPVAMSNPLPARMGGPSPARSPSSTPSPADASKSEQLRAWEASHARPAQPTAPGNRSLHLPLQWRGCSESTAALVYLHFVPLERVGGWGNRGGWEA